jgi:hypothetical protein
MHALPFFDKDSLKIHLLSVAFFIISVYNKKDRLFELLKKILAAGCRFCAERLVNTQYFYNYSIFSNQEGYYGRKTERIARLDVARGAGAKGKGLDQHRFHCQNQIRQTDLL